jgi:hypothetical protein
MPSFIYLHAELNSEWSITESAQLQKHNNKKAQGQIEKIIKGNNNNNNNNNNNKLKRT